MPFLLVCRSGRCAWICRSLKARTGSSNCFLARVERLGAMGKNHMKTQNVRSSLSPLAHDLSPVRILIRGTNWIGDAVMSEPALSAIRQAFPKADITLLVKPAIAELFQQHPAVDHLLIYEHRGRHARLSGKWALGSELRRGRFDVAILLQNAFEAALLSFLAGIP